MNILNQNLVLGLLSCALLPGIAISVSAQTPSMYAMRQSDKIPVKHVSATVSLKEALIKLKKFQNVRIAYKEGLLDGKLISAELMEKAESMETEAALRLLLSDFALAYMRVNKTQYSIYTPSASTILNVNSLMADKLKGKVTGPDGSPVPGASIVLKGNSNVAAMAGPDGSFELNLKGATPPFVLVISSMGFAKKEVNVTDADAPLAIRDRKSVV